MVDELIRKSERALSGFYLHNQKELEEVLLQLSRDHQPVLLIGVTFALLDFVALRQLHLNNTIVMETGGMKGRREELTRAEVHAILKSKLGVPSIHSEYGMTELLSQGMRVLMAFLKLHLMNIHQRGGRSTFSRQAMEFD
jgi:hypothetical protein